MNSEGDNQIKEEQPSCLDLEDLSSTAGFDGDLSEYSGVCPDQPEPASSLDAFDSESYASHNK